MLYQRNGLSLLQNVSFFRLLYKNSCQQNYDPAEVKLELSCLTFRNLASYIQDGRKITLQMPNFIFIQQIPVLNILNMPYNFHFLSSKCRLFHNAALFGFCITHILNTGVLKLEKKKESVAKRLMAFQRSPYVYHNQYLLKLSFESSTCLGSKAVVSVLLNLQVFWDITLFWASNYRSFTGWQYPYLEDQASILDILEQDITIFETPVTIHPGTLLHITRHLNLRSPSRGFFYRKARICYTPFLMILRNRIMLGLDNLSACPVTKGNKGYRNLC